MENLDKNTDWEMLARYLSGENPELKPNIDKWLSRDPQNAKLLEFLKAGMDVKELQAVEIDIEDNWLQVIEKANISQESDSIYESSIPFKKHSNSIKAIAMLRWAAVLLIMIGIPFLVGHYMDFLTGFGDDYIEVAVDRGSHQEIVLPDGSEVKLDAGSILKYSAEFDEIKREVYLDGEAFFSVTPNSEKPFIVHNRSAVVTVLGTEFNVRGWEHSKGVQVVVAEGKVSLESSELINATPVVISQGQLSTLKPNQPPSEPVEVDLARYLGWLESKIVFENASLNEVLGQLERWYDTKIILPDSSTGNERISVNIDKKSLNDVLELIGALTGLSYSIVDNEVRFTN